MVRRALAIERDLGKKANMAIDNYNLALHPSRM
jgi:hypothetical protein